MNGPRHDFLSGAAFSFDQHGDVALRNFIDESPDGANAFALAHEE